MNMPGKYTIYTIGHSTRSLDEFLAMIQSFEIKTLADIRELPGYKLEKKFYWGDNLL